MQPPVSSDFQQAGETMKVVTGYTGWDAAPNGATATIRLRTTDGSEQSMTFTAECLDLVGVALLEMKAGAEPQARAGVRIDDEAGRKFSAKAIQGAEVRVDIPDKSDRVVLNFWNSNGAHFPMLVLREFVHHIRLQLDRI